MSKSIVICIDGTNNDPTTGRTNVSRFFRMLEKGGTDQVAYYQPGVGTLDPDSPSGPFKRWARRVWDLASAAFFRRHVLSAYRFLMQVYEPGDRIYLIGFSRGAYTCRVIAGMLHRVGLLYRGHDEMLGFAWEIYRNKRNVDAVRRFRHYYAREVDIAFVGLWDTVSSIGSRFRPKSFPNTFENPSVRCLRHAIALDERRATYGTNLWTDKPAKGQSVMQVWFAGAHADVGGGYTGDKLPGIGVIPLAWMVGEAKSAGLRFDHDEEARLMWRQGGRAPAEITAGAVMPLYALEEAHDELTRREMPGPFWRLVEHIPLPKYVRAADGSWIRRWRAHRGAPRFVPEHTLIHESILFRRENLPSYAPPNLPEPLAPERICQ